MENQNFVIEGLNPISFLWILPSVLSFLTQADPPQCDVILFTSWHWKLGSWSHPVSGKTPEMVGNKHHYIKARLSQALHFINEEWLKILNWLEQLVRLNLQNCICICK